MFQTSSPSKQNKTTKKPDTENYQEQSIRPLLSKHYDFMLQLTVEDPRCELGILWIQSLLYWLHWLLGKGLLSNDSTFWRQICNLVCHNLIGWWGTISWWECIHQTTLKCNITPNISSILQWHFVEQEGKLHCSMLKTTQTIPKSATGKMTITTKRHSIKFHDSFQESWHFQLPWIF